MPTILILLIKMQYTWKGASTKKLHSEDAPPLKSIGSTYQICGKQSNISFIHVDSEIVRDADEPVAVVKWLAEFDNRRENRAEKAN